MFISSAASAIDYMIVSLSETTNKFYYLGEFFIMSGKFKFIIKAMLLCTIIALSALPALASISGCTVSSYTVVNDPTNTDYLNLITNCDTIELQDTLDIRFTSGFAPLGDKVIVFNNSETGKSPVIKTPAINLSNGTLALRPGPSSKGILGGIWPSTSTLQSTPATLIQFNNATSYPEASVMSSISGDTSDSTAAALWTNGYFLTTLKDSDNGKLKEVRLSWNTPPTTSSDTSSSSADVDDGGSGCNMGFGICALLLFAPIWYKSRR